MTHVYATRIEEDEGRFVLVLETDDGEQQFEIHGVALELYEQVQREIRPWYLEAESARQAVARGVSREEYLNGTSEDGYALDDPKHPTYHERMTA